MPGCPTPRHFLAERYREINADDIFNGAAALGFYLTLAIFPAMIRAARQIRPATDYRPCW